MRVFPRLLLSPFGIEAIIIVLLPASVGILATVVDATLLTALTSPIIWRFVVNPLRSIGESAPCSSNTACLLSGFIL